MYLTIRDDVADQIIEHGLSKTESKLFFYLLRLDRFGDRPVKLKVAQILLATGIGKTAYHAAVAKFEQLGWFDFRHSEVEVSNQCSQGSQSSESRTESSESRTESSEKRTVFPEKRTGIPEKRTGKANKNSGKADNCAPKAATDKGFGTPHTIQTYSDFKNSLSDSEREDFEKFALKKAAQLPQSPQLPQKWIEKNFEEIAQEWRKSRGTAPPSHDWENDPRRDEWLAIARSVGMAFIYQGSKDGKCVPERHAFYKWMRSAGLFEVES